MSPCLVALTRRFILNDMSLRKPRDLFAPVTVARRGRAGRRRRRLITIFSGGDETMSVGDFTWLRDERGVINKARRRRRYGPRF